MSESTTTTTTATQVNLAPYTDSLDAVPEAFRGAYVERAALPTTDFRAKAPGAYVLNAGDGENWGIANYGSMHRGLSRQTDETRAAKERLALYGDTTPEQIEEMRSQLEQRKDFVAPSANQAAIREELSREFGSKLESEKASRQTAQSDADKSWLSLQILREALKAGVVPSELTFFEPYLRDQVFHVEHVDGARRLVPREDKFSALPDQTGQIASPAEVFERLRKNDHTKRMFAANERAGGGTETAGGGESMTHSGPNPFAKTTLNITKAIAISNGDPALAKRLKAEAGAELHGAFASR